MMRHLLLFLLAAGWLPAQVPVPFLPERAKVIAALEEPMAKGMDVSVALTAWSAAESATTPEQKRNHYLRALAALENVEPLPQSDWGENPSDVRIEFLEELRAAEPGVKMQVIRFQVDGLTQYGLVTRPIAAGDTPLPLLIYVHGAAYGVPVSTIAWQADVARMGYVVAAPAFRGEPAFLPPITGLDYTSEGEVENYAGEPRDVLGLADGMRDLPYVRHGKFGIFGHSFGAGAGLLAAARSDDVACVISYDAWLVNPFTFYWLRLSGGSIYYWGSWEAYCEAPVPEQLSGLMARSIAHHVDRLKCPVQIFIGQLDGAGYHTCHDYLAAQLKAHSVPHEYHVIPNGSHNFALYRDEAPAKSAWKLQLPFMLQYFPPGKLSGGPK